jgi:acetyl-CoA C-acetyltransferase
VRKVAIIGVGCTKVDDHWGKSLRNLFADAALKALEDAGVERVDALYVGNMSSGFLQGQEHLGAFMADAIGMPGIPAIKVEAACASGGVAVHEGFKAVVSGLADLVLVGGVEKMTDALTPHVSSAMIMAEDQEYTAYTGITFVGLNALIHRLYMETFKAQPEEIAMFPVVDHQHAVNNSFAQFHSAITVDRVLKSPFVADPLHILECSGIGDGAAAAILCPLEKAQEFTDTPIEVAASTVATDTLSLHERDNLLTFSASQKAANKAYEIAKIGQSDVDVLEVHDAFSILGPLSLEDLGFVRKGEGAKFTMEGQTAVGGKLPTNTFGGLKARGHPVGATGVYQIVELTWQLQGEAGKNQVNGAEIGMAQNIGGIGTTVAVHILRRVK